MRKQQREEDQPCDMDCEHPVFIEVFLGVIGAVDGRHVVRVVKNQRQRIEDDRPGGNAGLGRKIAQHQQGCGPGPASDD